MCSSDLIYTLGGNTDSVVYYWNNSGFYTFNFYTSTGTSTSTYNGFSPCLLPTSENEINADDFIDVFPNPVHETLFLKLKKTISAGEIINILIMDEMGDVKFSSSFYAEKIKTENFGKGIYFMVIKTRDQVITKKIIVI